MLRRIKLYSYKNWTKSFQFSVNVVLPKTNLLSKFRSSTTSPYYKSHLSQDPTLTQLWKLLKYPKFRLKYLQRRSMLQKTEHTALKVGPRTNIIFKKIFGHSLIYCTGRLQTLHPPQGTLLNFFHYNAQVRSLWHSKRQKMPQNGCAPYTLMKKDHFCAIA